MAEDGYNPETDEAHRDDTQSALNGIKKIGATTVTVLSTLLGAVGVPAVAIGVVALVGGVILFNAIELDFVTSHPYATSETYAYHMMEDMNRETMYAGKVISG
ncbi:MAG: hypothetical protein K6E34_02365, partial [Lachnospiraceae bacterium]|nr:hypothetical protein [Lachnospiraceae bacterium]